MVMSHTVQQFPNGSEPPSGSLVFYLAAAADSFIPWGHSPRVRDEQLRQFWPTEPTLASTVYTVATQRASYSWTLSGPPRIVQLYQDMMHASDFGNGWLSLNTKLAIDLLTQDNGAFIEIIRTADSPEAPVIGLAHLDAGRCLRTGVPELPVIYTDRTGRQHELKAHQVIPWTEFPAPVESMNGMQYCAVTRVLRTAQLLRDIGVYLREKSAGTNLTAIHLVSGIPTKAISDAIQEHQDTQRQKGLTNYMLPAVIATLDPTATISHEQIDLASLPDNFDLDIFMQWYIKGLALAFGIDSQDLAPLSGTSNLGTSTQSLVLHMKSRGKGPALYIKGLEHKLNFHGVLPRNVTFNFDEQDMAADLEQAELEKVKAETRKMYYDMGAFTSGAVLQLMLDDGSISQEQYDSMQVEPDATSDVTVGDEEPAENKGVRYREIVRNEDNKIIAIKEWGKAVND